MNPKKIISTAPPPGDEPTADADSQGEWVEITAEAADHGQRLDRCLVARVHGLSRSYLQQLITEGCVWVNGKVQRKPSTTIHAGDACRLNVRPTEQARSFLPQPMELCVVYEDEHLMVLNKPAGLVVHPAAGNWSGTLLNGLLSHHSNAVNLPRAGIVHRLDKDTSGLMVVAKDRVTMDALVDLIAQRQVTRLYLAMTGQPWRGEPDCLVDGAIARDPVNRLKMSVAGRGQGKPSQTQFHVISRSEAGTLVGCKLFTGRTHQIRVHLAALGHPILADGLYRGRPHPAIERQALHAARLMLTHPVTGAALDLVASWPEDMAQAANDVGLAYNGAPVSPAMFPLNVPLRLLG